MKGRVGERESGGKGDNETRGRGVLVNDPAKNGFGKVGDEVILRDGADSIIQGPACF